MAYHFSEQQQIALAIVPRICVVTSFAACSFVAKSSYDVLKSRRAKQRLLLQEKQQRSSTTTTPATVDDVDDDDDVDGDSNEVDADVGTTPVVTNNSLRSPVAEPPPPQGKQKLCTNIYHRIMLSMSVTYCCSYIIKLWGPASVPEYYGIWGARGDTQTCTIHGFFVQLLGFPPLFYYMGLSFYSFAAVTNNFRLSPKFEVCLHTLVWIFPIASSIYLLNIEALNFNGYGCWIASEPLGCGPNKDYACTRGPKNIGLIQVLFGVVPVLVVLIIPTFVMINLIVYVKRNRSKITTGLDAKAVAAQSGWYLVVFYEITLIYGIDSALVFGLGKQIFWYRLFAICNERLVGLFISLVYFKLQIRPRRKHKCNLTTKEEPQNSSPYRNADQVDCIVQIQDDQSNNRPIGRCRSWCYTPKSRRGPSSSASVERRGHTTKSVPDSLIPEEEEVVFTIFDGVVGDDSPWANFLFDGDSDDEDADQEESIKWESTVQV